jgi:hypothetical protein
VADDGTEILDIDALWQVGQVPFDSGKDSLAKRYQFRDFTPGAWHALAIVDRSRIRLDGSTFFPIWFLIAGFFSGTICTPYYLRNLSDGSAVVAFLRRYRA